MKLIFFTIMSFSALTFYSCSTCQTCKHSDPQNFEDLEICSSNYDNDQTYNNNISFLETMGYDCQ